MDGKIRVGGGIRLSWQEGQRLKALKELDIQVCEFCQKVNLFNLGRLPWKPVGCQFHEKEHVLCRKLCLKVARSIVCCELYELEKEIREGELFVGTLKKDARNFYHANCWKAPEKHGWMA